MFTPPPCPVAPPRSVPDAPDASSLPGGVTIGFPIYFRQSSSDIDHHRSEAQPEARPHQLRDAILSSSAGPRCWPRPALRPSALGVGVRRGTARDGRRRHRLGDSWHTGGMSSALPRSARGRPPDPDLEARVLAATL